ncbi:FAD dependent oxidoreductase [Mycolicibacterium phlei]|uniref:FAD-dependent oxidoreductase n=1 Tax=Mycolicibacterium phlei DSM 43239 = CCUG 21000 TaxID=1226750 RepID=A0A5N5UU41_MYCPH|nr:FAD-dependent oxidoreductase [Mycolicibacterium phlei]VEG09267.1 FAD dependent oxidoreductase [Mycobacteroides chelonae]AMO61152.1 Gamma-glutamylputrescine oxidoreductase [Mycolicibacterium phlei]KAB7752597.1 FAD-dependent oxidoreductase [Mycolicibacterium phlei DSM 43239 = CCUG 21000]KXW60949.1 FAD-dependent oxidoreductase [Mycolicibacterium phlei DSM 43239 = CCUG 21000]KXW62826.1 FAD-dependent oxidoreductase [Mycolicibacterium phlei DSM 43072]
MKTVFDDPVDPGLIERSLSASTFASVWLDIPRPQYPELTAPITCDLLVVGGGYTGLWTALHAARRDASRRIVLIEANRIGWAASGRNGGFVDASLTHGVENGKARWPNEFDKLTEMGMENLDGMATEIAELGLDTEWERTGMLSVATEPHQVQWLREAADDGHGRFLDTAEVRAEVNSPTYRAGLFDAESCAIVNPAKLALELARACREAGVQIFEHTNAHRLDSGHTGLRVHTGHTVITARQAVLATNVFRSLLRRNRLYTVPVYDYVLATEPLTDAQLDRIGWANRQGVGDCGNQFHYYRLTRDNRIVWGGYDAVYHYGRRVDPRYEDRPATYRKLAAHFFLTFPQLDDVRFSHRWAGAIDTNTRFCAHWGLAREGRVAYVNGFTGLGVAATRFAADVCLDLLSGQPTPRTELEMVRKRPLPFPPEPLASVGIQATRWSLDRADHSAGRRNLFLRTLDALGLGFDS